MIGEKIYRNSRRRYLLRELLFLWGVHGAEFTSLEITKMKKSILLAAMAAAMLSTFVLSACDTTKGFGEDMSNAGQSLSNEAQKDK